MPESRFRFVIIEKDSFIARDMQSGLQAAVPDCDTRLLPNAAGAVEAFPRTTDEARTVLITKLSLAQLDESGLSQLARDSGAEIVVRLGDDPQDEVTRHGWLSLASPFTWEDLAELAGDLSARWLAV